MLDTYLKFRMIAEIISAIIVLVVIVIIWVSWWRR